MPQAQFQWLSPDEVLQRIHQVGNPEWDERGGSILKTVVEEWKKKKTKKPEVKDSPYGKSFLVKATQPGPKYTGSTQDASGRHNCFRDGKRVECEQFGGKGEGWSELRSQEDLYDALRRLVDELKAGNHDGWHELVGLLVHTDLEELKALKEEHGLSAPQDAKESILKRVRDELQHVGHPVGSQEQQPTKSYFTKAEPDGAPEAPKTPEPKAPKPSPHAADENLPWEKPQVTPVQEQTSEPPPPEEPTPPLETPPPELPPDRSEETVEEIGDYEDPDEYNENDPDNELMQRGSGNLEGPFDLEEGEPREDGLHPFISGERKNVSDMDRAFLQSIKESPSDSVPRLIYADWLEESGDPSNTDLAETIRLQERLFVDWSPQKAQEVQKRIRELEQAHPEWFWPWGRMGERRERIYRSERASAIDLVGGMASLDRGLLSVVGNANRIREVLNEVGDETALYNVEMVNPHGSLQEISQLLLYAPVVSGWMQHITSLSLNDSFSQYESTRTLSSLNSVRLVQMLANSKHTNGLQSLDLRNTGVGRDRHGMAIRLLGDSQNLTSLGKLYLSGQDLSVNSIDRINHYLSEVFGGVYYEMDHTDEYGREVDESYYDKAAIIVD